MQENDFTSSEYLPGQGKDLLPVSGLRPDLLTLTGLQAILAEEFIEVP